QFVFRLLLGSVAASVEEFDLALFQPEIRWDLVGLELVAMGDNVIVGCRPVGQHPGFVTLVLRRKEVLQGGPAARPFRTPLERTHHAVIVARGHTIFPVVHPAAVTFSHLQKLYRPEWGAVARNPMNMRLCTPNGAQRRLSGKALLASPAHSIRLRGMNRMLQIGPLTDTTRQLGGTHPPIFKMKLPAKRYKFHTADPRTTALKPAVRSPRC